MEFLRSHDTQGVAMKQGPRSRRSQPKPLTEEELHESWQKRARTKGTCSCGTCKSCLENARWNRIYKEKFEDPSYYNRPVETKYGSSLVGTAPSPNQRGRSHL